MKSERAAPPRLASWLLTRIVRSDERGSVKSDFREIHEEMIREFGAWRAAAWYWSQTLKSLPMFIRTQGSWRLAMLKNILTISWRNIKKQKIYSMITMSGLVLGLAVFLLFAIMVDFVKHQDQFHADADRIFAVVQELPGGRDGELKSAITPGPMASALWSEYPEIEKAARYAPAGRKIVRHRDKLFYENRVRFVDPEFLSIFSFGMEAGEADTALTRPNSILLTRDTARKYFGNENPMGKSLTLDNRIDLTITGILQNSRLDSSISFDFLVSMATAEDLGVPTNDWGERGHAVFLLLQKGQTAARLEEKLPAFIDKFYPDSLDTPRRLTLLALRDIYLKTLGFEVPWASGQASFVTIWVVAVLLLMIACFNFMNLSTARSLTRAREVGMRKVVGADRKQLIQQFLGESTILAVISLPAAVLLYEILRPIFAAEWGEVFAASLMDRPRVLILVILVTVVTGLFAGSYPAFFLSRFSPVRVLRGKIQSGRKGHLFRKILVVVQFTFSIILILIMLISVKQSRYTMNLDLGFDRSGIIAVNISDEALENLEILKKDLARHKDIKTVSATAALPIEWDTQRRVVPEGFGEEEAMSMNAYGVDYGFIEMLGLSMIEGRAFSRDHNDGGAFILNSTAVEKLEWEDPIGKRLTLEGREGAVIGVTRDFHFKTLFLEGVLPTVLYLEKEELSHMLVKTVHPEGEGAALEFVRERWAVLTPDLPFEHITLDQAFQDMLSGDKTAALTGFLGALAVLLSCMGLFGLSSYSVERRIKEIGIRKVLGASPTIIVRMLTKGFIKLVVIANLIAIPITYFLMGAFFRFLYAYPMDFGPDIFFITSGLSLLVAFLTVSSQTLKSATANPVNSLKYE